ncbi:hypothetical protein GNI_018450 [Gregarina niphandrodes]|uniref:Uncharacterized protein n=1 Tax=Gregarina niphandrodes TaxID=110365 RepID=A0A023BC32_GRENI|nr:hypothetical protein GNI_018450 [Gregarina niphandrodes]EZG81703.1 hypothetical protein GNI_018450 [Gregarina niphandrodes]|eukprot:XP_011134209.1 hypothetical protein GNI_018450 [Gregarina niphandrodes]
MGRRGLLLLGLCGGSILRTRPLIGHLFETRPFCEVINLHPSDPFSVFHEQLTTVRGVNSEGPWEALTHLDNEHHIWYMGRARYQDDYRLLWAAEANTEDGRPVIVANTFRKTDDSADRPAMMAPTTAMPQKHGPYLLFIEE